MSKTKGGGSDQHQDISIPTQNPFGVSKYYGFLEENKT